MVKEEIFNPTNIDIHMNTYTLYQMISRIQSGQWVLDSTYRRNRAEEWNQIKKSRWIESILVSIPINDFYLLELKPNNQIYVAIDGWQRMNTFMKFIGVDRQDPERFSLLGLKYLKEYEGAYFEDLRMKHQRRIWNVCAKIHILNSWVPEEVKKDIVDRFQ